MIGARQRSLLQNLETGERSLVIEDGADAHYVPSGHLVYARDDRLMAVPFDLGRLKATGHAVPVLEGVSRSVNTALSSLEVGAAQVAFSDTGVMAYAPGSVYHLQPKTLVFVDRDGRQEALAAEALDYWTVRVAENGRDMLMFANLREPNVWTFDADRGSMRRQTFEGGWFPIWGPRPGQFTYAVKASPSIVVKNVNTDAEGGQSLPIEIPNAVNLVPSSWSHDGRYLAFSSYDPITNEDIWVYSPETGVSPFVKTEFDEAWAVFSPDGRWIAYASNMSGAYEVYLRPFPGPGSAIQVSTKNGFEPAWSKTGNELYFNSYESLADPRKEISPISSPHRSLRRMACFKSAGRNAFFHILSRELRQSEATTCLMMDVLYL